MRYAPLWTCLLYLPRIGKVHSADSVDGEEDRLIIDCLLGGRVDYGQVSAVLRFAGFQTSFQVGREIRSSRETVV